ncbi:MAG: TIGR03118 family protein [Sulfuricaulis sp.]
MNALRMAIHRLSTALVVVLVLVTAPAAYAGDFYQQHNLVSDGFVPADHLDTNLVNAWGVAFNPFGPVWVADNGTGVSTLYDGAGNALSLIVNVPSPGNSTGGGNPTGIAFNGSTGFAVTKGNISGASKFIFATEDGLIAGWAPNVDSNHAITAVDNSATTGAVYKGLALSAGGSGSLLYAADFHNNRIDVFDSAFKPVTPSPGAFSDPSLPMGFAPFGLQAINGNLYVSYAKQDVVRHDDVKGKGLGFVDVFDPNGHLIQRVVSHGRLNAPWGMALAPAGFGKFSNRLLVGNFGDGRINVYNLATGKFVGRLKGMDHRPIQIDGLWGIAFGNGFLSQPVNTLFFAAGPDGEQHGLYGRIDTAPGNDVDNDRNSDD